MQIDVTKLLTGYLDYLELDKEINIPNTYTENSLIEKLENAKINATISLNDDNERALNGKVSGTMILKDDITLEPVEHVFVSEIEEILEKSKNILDITDILWQNILVEIPSKVRKTDEDIELSGDGWRVISEKKFEEERKKSNNPFSNLSELIKIKEEE